MKEEDRARMVTPTVVAAVALLGIASSLYTACGGSVVSQEEEEYRRRGDVTADPPSCYCSYGRGGGYYSPSCCPTTACYCGVSRSGPYYSPSCCK